MAQKQKARPKPKARSRGSTGKATKSSTAKSRKQTAGASRSGSRSKARSSSNGSGRIETARHTVEETAKDAGQTLGSAASKAGSAASKAKMPLLAGGAALAGAAGGLALGTRQARRHGTGAKMLSRRPQVKVRSQDLARAAKEVGSFGAQVGRLASELQQTREAAGNGKQRSPVEVVLDGLTARRSRG